MRRAILPALLVAAGVLVAAPARPAAAAATGALDVPAWIADLDRLAADVRGADAPRAAALARELPEAWLVRDASGAWSVPTRTLRAALRGASQDPGRWPDRRDAILHHLGTVRSEAEALRGGTVPDRSTARAALDEVLSGREFRRSAASAWMTDTVGRVKRWLANLLERAGFGGAASARASRALAWAAALGALAALSIWLFRLLRQSSGRAAPAHFTRGPAREGSRVWARRALAAASEGRPRDALLLAHRAALVRLEEDGVWRVDESRTPREYIRLLGTADGRRLALADLTRRIERVCYGGEPAASADADEAVARLQELGCDVSTAT